MFIKLPQVIQITGLSRSTIYSYIDKGTFPRQYKIGLRSVAWKQGEVDKWVEHVAKRN